MAAFTWVAPRVQALQLLRSATRARLGGQHGLRTQLVALVMAALLPSLVLQALGGTAVVHSFGSAHKEGLADAARRFAWDVDREIEVLSAALIAFSSSPVFDGQGYDLTILKRRALRVADAVGTTITVWTGEGEFVTNTPHRQMATFDLTQGPQLAHQAARSRSTVVTNEAGQQSAAIFVPVIRDGGAAFVLEAELTPERLEGLISGQISRARPQLIIADTDGSVIVGAGYTGTSRPARLDGWLLDSLVRNRSGIVEQGPPGESVSLIAFATPQRAQTWRVAIIEPIADYQRLLRSSMSAVAGVVILSILFAVGAAMWAGAVLARPLRRLTMAAQAVAAGAETLADVPPSSVTEFNALRVSVARADAVLRRRAAAERMALQEARTGHELLASVVNGTADQIHVKDLDLCFVLANQVALKAGTIPREEWQIFGRRLSDLVPSPEADREEALDRDVILSGAVREIRIERRRADASVGTFVMVKTPWRDASGQIAGVVTVVRDVTDQRAAEQRLAAVQGDLLRATRLSAMGAMASGLAHELNQPLAAMANFLNAAARILARIDPVTPQLQMARDAVKDAVGQALRAGTIVRRLREFVGRGEADLSIDDVCDVIREICDVARADGGIDHVHLIARIDAAEAARAGRSNAASAGASQPDSKRVRGARQRS